MDGLVFSPINKFLGLRIAQSWGNVPADVSPENKQTNNICWPVKRHVRQLQPGGGDVPWSCRDRAARPPFKTKCKGGERVPAKFKVRCQDSSDETSNYVSRWNADAATHEIKLYLTDLLSAQQRNDELQITAARLAVRLSAGDKYCWQEVGKWKDETLHWSEAKKQRRCALSRRKTSHLSIWSENSSPKKTTTCLSHLRRMENSRAARTALPPVEGNYC